MKHLDFITKVIELLLLLIDLLSKGWAFIEPLIGM